MTATKTNEAYWLNGTAYCAECVECSTPCLSENEIARSTRSAGVGRCGCCGVKHSADCIRYSVDGSVCMVWSDGEAVRIPTQDDLDSLPVGDDMDEDEIASLDA